MTDGTVMDVALAPSPRSGNGRPAMWLETLRI